MAGTLTISTLSDGTNSTSATNLVRGTCLAWVNFNGSGGAINASYNVSSITIQGTGYYSLNYTNALPNANYAISGIVKPNSSQTGNNARAINVHWNQTPTTTTTYIVTATSSAGYENFDKVYLVINGS